jgi:hypothetical protein
MPAVNDFSKSPLLIATAALGITRRETKKERWAREHRLKKDQDALDKVALLEATHPNSTFSANAQEEGLLAAENESTLDTKLVSA